MDEIQPQENTQVKAPGGGKEFAIGRLPFIPALIIVATCVIVGSVLYSTNRILDRLDSFDSPGVPGTPVGQAPPSYAIPERSDAPVVGNPAAPVTLVEFSDFECPFCERFFRETYPLLKSQYIDTGKVKLVFRHFPLTDIHPQAQKAAEAAECASRQGRFSDYHDILFAKGQTGEGGLTVPALKQYAEDSGLNTETFNRCLDNGETAAVVQKDLRDGASVGVSGTPNVFVNGTLVSMFDSQSGRWIGGALPFSTFKTFIDQALKK